MARSKMPCAGFDRRDEAGMFVHRSIAQCRLPNGASPAADPTFPLPRMIPQSRRLSGVLEQLGVID